MNLNKSQKGKNNLFSNAWLSKHSKCPVGVKTFPKQGLRDNDPVWSPSTLTIGVGVQQLPTWPTLSCSEDRYIVDLYTNTPIIIICLSNLLT